MTTVTTTTTDGASPSTTKPRVTPISGKSSRRSVQNQNFGGLSTLFQSMTPLQKAGWQGAASALNTAQARTGQSKLSATNAFSIYASGLLALGQPYQLDAPTGSALNLPLPLPIITVQATVSSVTGAASVTLNVESAVDNPVQILGAPYQIAGKDTWPDGAFSPIGSLLSLDAGATDISALVTDAFGPLLAGEEIGLRLVATSAAGLRRDYKLVTTICRAVSAEAADPLARAA